MYVVPTPIGNLEDITLRALRVLREVSVVAAEDTRSTQHLLTHFEISKPLVSYFEGNEAARSEELVARMRGGEDVALVSEAGMPGVSDPGARLIRAAIDAGVEVVVLPGASAAITALVGSGLPTDEFHFVGFLPREAGPRDARIGSLRTVEGTLIFYEAPGRTADTLRALSEGFGDRRACVARELTKIHEEFARGSLFELAQRDPPRGEVCIVVEGSQGEAKPDEAEIESEIRRRVAAGESAKEIAAALSLRTGKPRRALYQLALSIKR